MIFTVANNWLALTLQSPLSQPFEPPTEKRATWLSVAIGLPPSTLLGKKQKEGVTFKINTVRDLWCRVSLALVFSRSGSVCELLIPEQVLHDNLTSCRYAQ